MSKLSRRTISRTIATKLLQEPQHQTHWVQVLAAYLVEQNRIDEADLIVNDIAHELYEQDGQLLASVSSARPLSEAVRDLLKDTLKQETEARKVTLAERVDPSLLGGLLVRTPTAQMDVSVRTKLNQLATIK